MRSETEMEEEDILEKLETAFKEEVIKAKIPRKRRIFVSINKEALIEVMRYVTEKLGIKHLSTITGVDLGEEIELIYHLAYEGRIELSLRMRIPKEEKPSVPTIISLIPGAVLYEREVHDLLGVEFSGHPDLSPLILPEEWPEGVYPLRKECKLEDLRKLVQK